MADGIPLAAEWPEFIDLIQRLSASIQEPGTVVIVEGERDRRSLNRLGITGPIHLLHRGQRMPELAQRLTDGNRRVIILTDWDTEGGHLARRLGELLGAGSATVDLEFRRRFARLLHGEVVHVEALAGWARRRAERAGAPLEHFLSEGQS